jgi:uncharacterized protein (TIGR00730 family)
MTLSSSSSLESLQIEVTELIRRLPNHAHGEMIQQALATILSLAEGEADRLDWKILSASLQDMKRAFQAFHPYRHVRKIAIFGSARLSPDTPEYKTAVEFARCVTQLGFMVMTGAGPGIMQAGNEGAGPGNSFGLNIMLPFEQGSNPFIEGDPKLINFKYFFTRKLFFLRECDALALFPGGFGTQDEAFECLTLVQTGKSDFLPLVLIDKPGGDYWQSWYDYIYKHLLQQGLISSDDFSLFTITDRLDVACDAIAGFYRVFHSNRYVKGQLVLHLKTELLDQSVDLLNQDFSDILLKGKIEKGIALVGEGETEMVSMPCLRLYFDQRNFGRLYQMLNQINQLAPASPAAAHPEQK